MKLYFPCLALVFLAIPGVVKADVQTVLSNYAGAPNNNGFGNALSGNNIVFSTPGSYQSSFLGTFTLRVYNNDALNEITGMNLKFSLSGATSGNIFSDEVVASGDFVASSSYANSVFTFSSLPNQPSGADTYTLSWTIDSVTGGVANSDVRWGTTSNGMAESSGWTFGSSSVAQGQFLLTANVPEPTTMILTGSALACGFGASLLRRFRKKTDTLESPT